MNTISFSTIDGSASYEDLTELAKIHLTRKWAPFDETSIEKEEVKILNNMNSDLLILIKNEQEEWIWYCFLDTTANSQFWIYSLFIQPTYRQQWIATKTLQHLAHTLGQDKEVFLEIHPQEEYTRMQRPIITEKLIQLARKCGYSITEEGKKLRASTWPTSTPPID